MNKEAKNLVKKTAKIAGVTCVAAGAVALMTTGAALKALTEGAKYLKDTVKKIVDEEPKEKSIIEESTVVEASAEDFAEAEAVAAEESSEVQEATAE